MKVLIVKLSAFGDIIHALPALEDLLAHPEVDEVHWLIDQRYAFVSEVFPSRVVIHRVALKGEHPLRSAWQTIRTLRGIGFDLILDLQGLIKSALLARAVGSPVYGIDKSHMREKVGSLLVRPVTFHPDERHVVQQYRRVAAALFSNHEKEHPIAYSAPHIDLAHSRIKPEPQLLSSLGIEPASYVILHAAGGWQTKMLPETSWVTIGKRLKQDGVLPLFSWGSQSEEQMAQHLAEQCNGFALPERLNMSALCTLLQGARAIVGADTGLLHLAAALDTPTITFWGPSASWRSAPLNDESNPQGGRNWHIESNPACGPCFKRQCNRFVCMDAIAPDAIARILHEL